MPSYEQILMGGMQTSSIIQQRIRPLLMRLDPKGGIHLWNAEDGSITSMSGDGNVAGKLLLPASETSRVIDFAAGDDRFCLLLDAPDALRCVDRASGAELWTREHKAAKTSALVLVGDSLFVTGESEPKKVLELRTSDGSELAEHELSQGIIRLFATADGKLVSPTFFRERRRRGVLIYDPATRQESSSPAGPELYGALLSAFGSDSEHNLYVYGTALKSTTPTIFKVTPEGTLVASEPLRAVVLGSHGRILIVSTSAERFHVRIVANGDSQPRTADIERPAALRAGNAPTRIEIVGATDHGLLIDVLDPSGSVNKRISLDLTTGAAADVPGADSVSVFGQQVFKTWQVGSDGSIFMPVTSAEELAVVRVRI